MRGATTRRRIVEAADRLFYQHGYEHTSFTAIAEAVNLSRGNFYHYFKTKDAILDAVIETRLADTRAMLRQWEAEESDPADRIRRFVHLPLTNHADIRAHGCPVGTLTTELAKLNHARQPQAAALFTLFRTWLRDQFALLAAPPERADALAMHVLAFSQGVATLDNAFDDEDFVRREVRRMCEWLDEYAPTPT